MKVSLSPDIILCGWLGLKHLLIFLWSHGFIRPLFVFWWVYQTFICDLVGLSDLCNLMDLSDLSVWFHGFIRPLFLIWRVYQTFVCDLMSLSDPFFFCDLIQFIRSLFVIWQIYQTFICDMLGLWDLCLWSDGFIRPLFVIWRIYQTFFFCLCDLMDLISHSNTRSPRADPHLVRFTSLWPFQLYFMSYILATTIYWVILFFRSYACLIGRFNYVSLYENLPKSYQPSYNP